ncbi:thioesterase family protein [Brachybacterium sp. YJGR34]|uniref:thioesterase family protein n=1 Tax=Brachybacterium sp. YJGR34 TaxID=2059911 RepID=UPI000E0ADBEA|nr:thioesterase family protein [Brachybacterium sp. YJGR34]
MSSLSPHRSAVREEWIDYNGHLSEAYYVLVFGHATDQVMEQIGLGPAERERTGSSLYTVEAHVRYLQEVALGAELEVTTVIAGSAAKKLHLAHEMRSGGELVATEEILALHVAGEPARATPFPESVAARIAELTAAGADAPAPEWTGRAIRV